MTVTLGEHRSYSQYSSYVRCGKQYELTRVHGYPETPTWAQVAGNAIHSALEDHTRQCHGALIDVLPFAEYLDRQIQQQEARSGIPHTEWRATGRKTKEKPNGEDKAWWLVDGPRQVAEFIEWYERANLTPAELNRGPGIEYPVDMVIAGIDVKAYIDNISVTRDGELVVIDYKSGTRKPDQEIQLGLYALGLELGGDPRPSIGAYYMTRTAELTPAVNLDRYTLNYFEPIFTQLDAGIRAGVFLPHVSSMCNGCGVAQYCTAVGGTPPVERTRR